jgi:hypothetical protein
MPFIVESELDQVRSGATLQESILTWMVKGVCE